MEIHIARDGSALGVFPEQEVREGLASGRFVASDLAWRPGMATWSPLGDWPEFSGLASPGMPTRPLDGVMPALERGPSFGAFFATLRDVILNPFRTFDALPRGEFGRVIGFQYAASIPAWICGSIIWTGLVAVMASVAPSGELEEFRQLGAGGPFAVGAVMCLGLGCVLVLMPLFAFIGAGVIHLLLLPWSPAGGFAQTYRAYGYVNGAFLFFGFIPCVNYISGVWSFVSTIIALSRVHRIAWWKVLVSLVLPICVLLLLFVGLASAAGGLASGG